MHVLFEDNHLIVVEKNSGVLVQGDSTGDETLADKVKSYIKYKYNKPGDVFLGIIHRLDRPVSGVIVFARTSKALGRMNDQFRNREVGKTYIALVEGMVQDSHQTLNDYLIKDKSKNQARIVSPNRKGAKLATLSYERKAVFAGRSMLSINLKTGRPHQIRVQLSNVGHPICGDLKYGATTRIVDRSIALHCSQLSFTHPVTKVPLSFSVRLPRVGIWQEFQHFQ